MPGKSMPVIHGRAWRLLMQVLDAEAALEVPLSMRTFERLQVDVGGTMGLPWTRQEVARAVKILRKSKGLTPPPVLVE